MLYSITLIDRPDSAALRAANAAAHLAYIRGFFPQILLGGPLLATDGESMIGSQIVIDLPDQAALSDFVDNEPYNQAGLFKQILMNRFRAATMNPELIEGATP